MRMRARYIHHIEALVDNTLGLVINFTLTLLIFNVWMGHDISYSDNAWASVVFFIVAYVRKYTLRRWFSDWIGRVYMAQPMSAETKAVIAKREADIAAWEAGVREGKYPSLEILREDVA